jgi:phage terminase large subunit
MAKAPGGSVIANSGELISIRRTRKAATFGAVASAIFAPAIDASETIAWPDDRYADDPVGFARDILGVELWDKQIEIVESIRDHRNTTCRSGHKCGKTTALAVAALWFVCTFPRARVLMTAVKASQVDEVMWKEVRRLHKQAKKRGTPIGGELHVLARSGLRFDDERQIWGATARDGEGLAGISGPNILILVDEASGVPDRFFEVLGTSLAGDGGVVRKCYISNPTRTTGEFYKSHTVNVKLFNALHISSEETPNARGLAKVPGLAGREWIDEKATEYGVDSYAYNVRVKGNFVHDRDGKIISLDLLALAKAAWEEALEIGDLQIGIDPAGDGVLGDETAIAVRRGSKIITVFAKRGLSEDDIVDKVLELIAEYRRPREPNPRVAIDAEGGIGTRVLEKLRAHEDKSSFELVPVRSGKKMWGSPEYHLERDALWGQAAKWITAGGAIPDDDEKLAEELNAPSFIADANRRYRATEKKLLRKALGRSTDRADAMCLAIWGFESIDLDAEEREAAEVLPAIAGDDLDDLAAPTLDPYAAMGVWR